MAYLRKLSSHVFKTYPLVSNAFIYGGLYMTAEISQQTVLKKLLRDPTTTEPPYNFDVVKNYGILGTCAISPTLFYWYKWLDSKLIGTGMKVVVKKCLMDQFMMTPNILIIFYVGMSILERKDDILEELQKKFVTTFTANACFWLPTQAINFTFIPSQFRIVYIGFCTLIWANILCYFKRRE